MKEFNGSAEIDLLLLVIGDRTSHHTGRERRPPNWTAFWKQFNASQQEHLHDRLGYIVLSGNFDEPSKLRVRDHQLVEWGKDGAKPSPDPAEVNSGFPNARDLETLLLEIATGCGSGLNYTDDRAWERLFCQEQREAVFTKLEELFPKDQ